MVIKQFADLLGKNNIAVEGESMFLGKSIDVIDNNIILLSEEANVDQTTSYGERFQAERAIITIRIMWGNSYLSSETKALEIYNFLRNNKTTKSFMLIEPQRPVFIDKIKQGQKYQFNMLVNLQYNSNMEGEFNGGI